MPPVVDGGELIVDSPLRALKADGRKVLLYLGRIHPKKGIVNLLKAWKQASGQWSVVGGRCSEWVLAIAGWEEGRHEDELKRLATELGIAWTDGRGQGEGTTGPAVGGRKTEDRGQRTVGGSPLSVVFLGLNLARRKRLVTVAAMRSSCPHSARGCQWLFWRRGPMPSGLMTPGCNLPEGFAGKRPSASDPMWRPLPKHSKACFALRIAHSALWETKGAAWSPRALLGPNRRANARRMRMGPRQEAKTGLCSLELILAFSLGKTGTH